MYIMKHNYLKIYCIFKCYFEALYNSVRKRDVILLIFSFWDTEMHWLFSFARIDLIALYVCTELSYTYVRLRRRIRFISRFYMVRYTCVRARRNDRFSAGKSLSSRVRFSPVILSRRKSALSFGPLALYLCYRSKNHMYWHCCGNIISRAINFIELPEFCYI